MLTAITDAIDDGKSITLYQDSIMVGETTITLQLNGLTNIGQSTLPPLGAFWKGQPDGSYKRCFKIKKTSSYLKNRLI